LGRVLARKFIDWRGRGSLEAREIGGVGVISIGEENLTSKDEPQDEEGSLKAGPADVNRPEAELLSRLKYIQADFENYRKRTDKEMKEVEERTTKGLVLRLLSVLDELDLAVKHSDDARSTDLQEGIEMVQKNLYSILQSSGLEKIDSVGQVFDPAKHEAAEKVQGTSQGADKVVEELRAGYAFRGHVIRPSMVKVELALKEPVEGGIKEGECE